MPKSSYEYLKFAKEYQSASGLLEKRAAELGDKTFLLFKDEEYSYKKINELTDRIATGFAELGIKKGSRVAIFAYNSPEWIMSFFALAKLGATTVTVNTAFKGEPLIYPIVQSESEAVIVDSRLLDAYKGVEDELKTVKNTIIAVKSDEVDSSKMPSKPHVTLDELKEYRPKEDVKARSKLGDPMCIIYTSGTTGPSKGCVLPHGFGLYNAYLMVDYLEYTPNDIIYTCLPLFHANALALSTLAAVAAGATLALGERFSASRFWEEIVKYKATEFNFIGTILHILHKRPPSPYEKEHNVRVAFGAPVPKEIFKECQERFNLLFVEGYGLTENGIVTLWSYRDAKEGKMIPGSMGKETPFAEVKIMDPETGEILPPGKQGEIVSRPRLPFAMYLGYYKMPEKTVEAWQNLWFHTGDLGYMDENGAFYFLDRIKDAIRRRGENISSWELEKAILRHPKIAEVAAIPVPSELGEDEIKVCIVLKPKETMTPEEFMQWCEENLPYFWIPRYVEFKDSLPKTPTQRVEKYKLRAEGITPNTWDREKAGYKIKKR
ncbi:AMP-binding protein [Archaeoglobus sp.]